MAWKVVYKTTWPDGKAFIGSDLTHSNSLTSPFSDWRSFFQRFGISKP